MGMTIDEAINTINNHSMHLASCNDSVIDSIQFLIDLAKKYQKIEQIVDKWNKGIYEDEGLLDAEVMELVSNEVYEDGNDTTNTGSN